MKTKLTILLLFVSVVCFSQDVSYNCYKKKIYYPGVISNYYAQVNVIKRISDTLYVNNEKYIILEKFGDCIYYIDEYKHIGRIYTNTDTITFEDFTNDLTTVYYF